MADADIRWRQRFHNFKRALLVLERGLDLARQRPLSELEYQGMEGIIGSRDATRLAFQHDLISDGEGWMAMIKARNPSSHTDNLEQAHAIGAAALARIDADLADLLLPWVIDLSCLASIRHPALLAHIKRAGVELYRRPDAPD
jgi:hypothetical protein